MTERNPPILYSIGCPKCNVLKRKLHDNGVQYTEITAENEIRSEGITEVPVLKVDGRLLTFSEAIKWLETQ